MTDKENGKGTRTRVLIASDIHWCHLEWYGMPNADRLEKFARDIEAEYKKDSCSALLLLGDYSLDHWQWNTQGSYLKLGISNTEKFAKTFIDRLRPERVELRMIAGNHEQYGETLWERLTGGYKRKDHLIMGNILFILLDNYGVHLDPRVHSDGTYCGVDVEWVRSLMAEYPDKRVILCAHHFAPEVESDDFKTLMREEDRILCLFSGHVHKSRVIPLGDAFGGKSLLYTGHYSYSSEKEDPLRCPCGFRELIITDEGITSRYITPENTYVLKERIVTVPYGSMDEFELKF